VSQQSRPASTLAMMVLLLLSHFALLLLLLLECGQLPVWLLVSSLQRAYCLQTLLPANPSCLQLLHQVSPAAAAAEIAEASQCRHSLLLARSS
jgi:hypothetical protein